MSYNVIDSGSLPCNRSEALLTDIVTQVFQTVCHDGVPVKADAYPFDGEGISRYVLVLSYEGSCDWRFVFSIYPNGYMDALDLSVLSCDGIEEPCGELNPDYRTCMSYEDSFIGSCYVNDPTEVQEFSDAVCEIISTLVCEELSYGCSFESSKPSIRFHRCFEVTSRDIPNLSDRKSQSRARSSNIVARYQSFDKETGEVKYDVTSQSKAGRSYTVTFKLHDWHPDQTHLDDEIQHAVKGNIEIDCTCPAFLYQGYKYMATMNGSSIDPEVRPPNQTNKDRHGFACKHILKAIDSFNQDYDKFRAEGRGMWRRHSLKVHHKYEGSVSFGQKGYVGQSMSVRAKSAYDGGEMPKSKWSKTAILDALRDEFGDSEASGFGRFSKDVLFQNCLRKSSWHHTGKFANPTDFFSLDREKSLEFADSQKIASMATVIADDASSKQARALKDAEDREKASADRQAQKAAHKADLEHFMDHVKDSVTEPEELPDGKWMVTYASPKGDTVRRRFAGYSFAKNLYDRLLLGRNDPAKDSDDFWDRAFYWSSNETIHRIKHVEVGTMIRTRRRRNLRRNESFDGRTIRTAQDLTDYLKKKGFGDVSLDEDSDNNEIEFFNDEVTLLYDGLQNQIQLEYYEPATASEIIDSLEGSIDEDTDVEDIDDMCRDEAGVLSEYTSSYTLDLPVRVSELEELAWEIADRVQKIREEAIADAADELMERYGLNR